MKRFRACLSGMSLCLAGVLSAFVFPAPSTAATCTQWVAKVVSAQGSVQGQRMGENRPLPARLNDTFCPGDKIRVDEGGRAVLLLSNETLLRLDQNTTIRFYEPEKERNFLLDLLDGAAYFITRTPKRFQCTTPFVNAGVEGTEFLLAVGNGKTFLSSFEGTVLAENVHGALRLTGGQSAVAEEGKPPVVRIVARPRDAVQWTLYYPPILPPDPAGLPPGSPETWQSRVSRLLSVGRVDEAKSEIGEILKRTPGDASALSLQSVIAVSQNEKGNALDLARKAVTADPRHAPARIALSYAQQAGFDLVGARTSVGEALRLEPGNALAWARMSELWMSSGDLDKALDAANKAAGISPGLARTQSVLGFAYLAQIKTKASKEAFEKAIVLDQADPLPRLGLGLARIREGDVSGGRTEIEIAASLSPNDSLVRSYLGKAYFEEKRDKPASSQFGMAKELDPNDPTPWFYDAIRKQTLNRPVEALHDLQKSISLNDHRAVYRSRLLLDEDLAARSASLGRIYSDLGFQQLALVEGWKSVNTDPANYSAHRFLADSYSALPRHEIARVSELLQSQLLQPININPLQPHLEQYNLSTVSGAGPADLSFSEFNSLFNRDRFTLQASGIAGNQHTLGDELVQSGVSGGFSYSMGQFHYQTDGFRTNNDINKNVYNVFAQGSLSYKTSIQAEFRSENSDSGDLFLRFNPDDFYPEERQGVEIRSARLGFHHAFSPGSDLIGSFIYEWAKSDVHEFFDPSPVDFKTDMDNYSAETQYLLRSKGVNLVIGAGYITSDQEDTTRFDYSAFGLPPDISITEIKIRHANLYLYSQIHFPRNVTWTLGGSADFVHDEKGTIADRDQFNPKLGVTWNPFPGTLLRGALFRVLRKTLPTSHQTLEPTQVSGFNQFFDDGPVTDSWRYGAGADQKFSENLFAGVEYSRRDLKEPLGISYPPEPTVFQRFNRKERLGRAYLYWMPHPWISLKGEYQQERLDNDKEVSVGVERVATQRVPLGMNFYHPCGGIARISATYYDQEGNFQSQLSPDFEPGADRFWLVDAAIGYRLPRRLGLVALEGKNLFDHAFKYQETDPFNAQIQPTRSIYFKITLAM